MGTTRESQVAAVVATGAACTASVYRWLRGRPIRASVRARIERAVGELGLPLAPAPPPAPAAQEPSP